MRRETLGHMPRGRRLVVQMQDTFREKMVPGFVEELDAWNLQKAAHLPIPPVMIYGDDLTHIVTETGIAYLHKCTSLEERTAAIRAVAGYTPVGRKAEREKTKELRRRGIVKTPEDLGIDVSDANRSLLAAKSIRDLVEWSKGLYHPPVRFKTW